MPSCQFPIFHCLLAIVVWIQSKKDAEVVSGVKPRNPPVIEYRPTRLNLGDLKGNHFTGVWTMTEVTRIRSHPMFDEMDHLYNQANIKKQLRYELYEKWRCNICIKNNFLPYTFFKNIHLPQNCWLISDPNAEAIYKKYRM